MGNLALGRWNYFRWTININRTTGSVTPTHCATVSLVSSDHQGRATAVVHRIDLCPVAKHQLQSCDILSKCSGVQRGPSGKHSNILIRSTTTLNQRRRRFYTISATEIISEIKTENKATVHSLTFLWHLWCWSSGSQQIPAAALQHRYGHSSCEPDGREKTILA